MAHGEYQILPPYRGALPRRAPLPLMPARLRRLSAREVLRALAGLGFELASVRGSQAKLRRVSPDGTRQILTVPLHAEFAPGTLRSTVRQASRFVSKKN